MVLFIFAKISYNLWQGDLDQFWNRILKSTGSKLVGAIIILCINSTSTIFGILVEFGILQNVVGVHCATVCRRVPVFVLEQV